MLSVTEFVRDRENRARAELGKRDKKGKESDLNERERGGYGEREREKVERGGVSEGYGERERERGGDERGI